MSRKCREIRKKINIVNQKSVELGWNWEERKKDTDQRYLNYSSETKRRGKTKFCSA